MLNYNFLPISIKDCKYYSNSANKSLMKVIKSLMKVSKDTVIVTDDRYRVILSNSDDILCGENIVKRLKLKANHIGKPIANLRRSLIINKKHTSFNVSVMPMETSEENKNDGYIFLLQNITKQDKHQEKLYNLVNFLKHDLKTFLLSQIMALKILNKEAKDNGLLLEVLNSCESSYRILKNYLQEMDFVGKELSLSKKEWQMSAFAQNITSECTNFFCSKKNTLDINVKKDSKIYVDLALLEEALVNILFQVNENSPENSLITVNMSKPNKMLKIQIIAPKQNFSKERFENNVLGFRQEYGKIADNSGLHMAKAIIEAHSGRIEIEQEENNTVLSIFVSCKQD